MHWHVTTVQSFPGILKGWEKDKRGERKKCPQAAGERDFCLTVSDLMLYPKIIGPNKKYLINTRLNRGTKGTDSLGLRDGRLCECQPKRDTGQSTRLAEGKPPAVTAPVFIWVIAEVDPRLLQFCLKKLNCLYDPQRDKRDFLLGNSHTWVLAFLKVLSHFQQIPLCEAGGGGSSWTTTQFLYEPKLVSRRSFHFLVTLFSASNHHEALGHVTSLTTCLTWCLLTNFLGSVSNLHVHRVFEDII